jgi:hypothetical protein
MTSRGRIRFGIALLPFDGIQFSALVVSHKKHHQNICIRAYLNGLIWTIDKQKALTSQGFFVLHRTKPDI